MIDDDVSRMYDKDSHKEEDAENADAIPEEGNLELSVKTKELPVSLLEMGAYAARKAATSIVTGLATAAKYTGLAAVDWAIPSGEYKDGLYARWGLDTRGKDKVSDISMAGEVFIGLTLFGLSLQYFLIDESSPVGPLLILTGISFFADGLLRHPTQKKNCANLIIEGLSALYRTVKDSTIKEKYYPSRSSGRGCGAGGGN